MNVTKRHRLTHRSNPQFWLVWAAKRHVASNPTLSAITYILADYRALGDEVWSRFSASKDDVMWYYRELVDAFCARSASPLVEELSRLITDIETLAAQDPQSSRTSSTIACD